MQNQIYNVQYIIQIENFFGFFLNKRFLGH